MWFAWKLINNLFKELFVCTLVKKTQNVLVKFFLSNILVLSIMLNH